MNTSITVNGQSGTIQPDGLVRFGSDDQMNVLFYKKSVHDPEESRRRGMPWSKAMDYVRIQQPGEKDYIDRPVSEDDQVKIRWPHHWARYQQGQAPAPDGSPVECLFPQHPEIAANLHSVGVHTVQQLAGLTTHGEQSIGMGASQWKQKAKDYLAAANGGSGMHRLQKHNEELQNKIEVQANQIALLKGQLDRLAAQVTQKIQPGMIQYDGAPLAQIAVPLPVETHQNQFGADDDFPEAYASAPAGRALFTDEFESDGDVMAAPEANEIQEPDQPRKGGWPKGKPRK